MKKSFLLLLLLATLVPSLYAQSFQIARYGIKEGLSHESTYTLIQDTHGFIWAGTSQGLSRFDGQSFTNDFIGDTISTAIAAASYMDDNGRVWFGHLDGSISMFNGTRFKSFKLINGVNSAIIGFSEDAKGNILAMTQQQGLLVIGRDLKIKQQIDPFVGSFSSEFQMTDDGNMLVGGFVGMSLYTYEKDSSKYLEAGRIPGIPFTRIQTIEPGLIQGSYWVGTEDEGLFFVKGSGDNPSNYKVKKIGVDLGLDYSSVSSVMIDERGYLWVSDYGVGVYRFKLEGENLLSEKLLFTVSGGLPEEYIKTIMSDDEGNVWFGSQSKGLAVLRDQSFTFYHFENGVNIPQITALSLKSGSNYFGSKKGLLFWVGETEENRVVYSPANGLPNDVITALWQDSKGNVYIGTESSGIFRKNINNERISRYFYSNNSLGNSINAITGDDELVWVASNNGVYKLNLETGKTLEHQSTSTGLPHNLINDILIDHEARVWIATRANGLYCVSEDLSKTMEGSSRLEFVSLVEDDQGRIWAGTKEDGVFKFGKDTLAVYSVGDGLKSKYTYAVGMDKGGYIWVGHRLGLSRIDQDTKNITVYGPELGFTSDISHDAIRSASHEIMVFGTTEGFIKYDPKQTLLDTLPPRLSVTQVNISDSIYDVSQDIKLPYGAYKLRIDFIGINHSNPDQVSYRYKLDGFDDWSDPSKETFAKYSRIEDGNYTFLLQACDGNGNCTGEISVLNISVKIPIWKAWWFILSSIVLVILGVYYFIKRRERKQKAMQDYLENQLDLRTREVIHQKEEIEVKNRDITDSINYAQRIQASILPPIQRLHHTFGGSFVFYQPRDIVSGDFYWYDKLDDDRFLIVCADSTGHGVPGAFMSMIGTTLIKDICLRENVNTPSDVLQTLDTEVREALNQNAETDGSNDGMDIIVAEINLKTNRFIVSSAMRPVILYKGGEQIYVKGSRSSVGGQLDDERTAKEFSNEVFDLKKGDIVYMFSDGYPDQFGGPLGRKFKMVRLKNLLRDINDKPMDEQYNYIKSNFFLWKEDLEQVDDVLFMGIKI